MYEAQPGRWPSFAALEDGGGDPHLTFAVLAPVSPDALVELAEKALWDDRDDLEADDEPRSSWWIQRGTAGHNALIGIEHEPPLPELEEQLAALGVRSYLVVLSGWDDPDEGLPSITRFEAGDKREVWAAIMPEESIDLLMSGDEDLREWATDLSAQAEAERDPSIIDPWELARSLGIELPAYRHHDDPGS